MSEETIEQKFAETVAKRDAHWLEEVERVTAERDQLRAQVAQLMGALEKCQLLLAHVRGLSLPSYTALQDAQGSAFAALSTPAPPVIEREKVLLLGEAITHTFRWLHEEDNGDDIDPDLINKAFDHARQLGLVEEGR